MAENHQSPRTIIDQFIRQTDYTPESVDRFVAEQDWTAYVQLDVPNSGSAALPTDEELDEVDQLVARPYKEDTEDA